MQITTERLVLREYVSDDWLALARYQADPRYQRHEPWHRGRSVDDFAQDLVARFVCWQQEQPRFRFQLAICLEADLIGSCGIRQNGPNSRSAELGYELAPAFWGRGYATEAAAAMLSWAFSSKHVGGLGLSDVCAEVVSGNDASLRVLGRLGMTLRARRSDYYAFRDRRGRQRWRDGLVYGILLPRWERAVAAGDHQGLDDVRVKRNA